MLWFIIHCSHVQRTPQREVGYVHVKRRPVTVLPVSRVVILEEGLFVAPLHDQSKQVETACARQVEVVYLPSRGAGYHLYQVREILQQI